MKRQTNKFLKKAIRKSYMRTNEITAKVKKGRRKCHLCEENLPQIYT